MSSAGRAPDSTGREEAFDHSAESYRAVLDSLNEAVIVVGRDLRVVMANATAERLLGAGPGSLVGNSMDDPRYLTVDEDNEVMEPAQLPVVRCLRDNVVVEPEIVGLQLPDESFMWLTTSARPLGRAGEEPYAVVASLTDITRYKSAERELARSNQDLSQFASVVSHDLSAPLTVIAGMVELIKRREGESLTSDSLSLLDRVGRAAEGGRRLIGDLLAFARLGTDTLKPAPVNLGLVMTHVLELLEPYAAERDCQVSVAELPSVTGDETQLHQLMQNLVGNAIKFGPPGGGGRVDISAERIGGEWRIAVADDGIGIEHADQEDVFHMMSRGKDAAGYPGTGIGLAVCERIVQRHGGRLGVHSEPGKGSTFWFTIPIA